MTIGPESAHNHLAILQGIISRMAANSASSKTWCVTLVSAILVMVADKEVPRLGLIALTPIIVFALLDAYYLALERAFIVQYSQDAASLRGGTAPSGGHYAVGKPSISLGDVGSALWSVSVLPVYSVLAALAIACVRWL